MNKESAAVRGELREQGRGSSYETHWLVLALEANSYIRPFAAPLAAQFGISVYPEHHERANHRRGDSC